MKTIWTDIWQDPDPAMDGPVTLEWPLEAYLLRRIYDELGRRLRYQANMSRSYGSQGDTDQWSNCISKTLQGTVTEAVMVDILEREGFEVPWPRADLRDVGRGDLGRIEVRGSLVPAHMDWRRRRLIVHEDDDDTLGDRWDKRKLPDGTWQHRRRDPLTPFILVAGLAKPGTDPRTAVVFVRGWLPLFMAFEWSDLENSTGRPANYVPVERMFRIDGQRSLFKLLRERPDRLQIGDDDGWM